MSKYKNKMRVTPAGGKAPNSFRQKGFLIKDFSLFIIEDTDSRSIREGSFAISIEVLEQKLLLHQGLVMVSQGHYNEAKNSFIECINLG